MTLPADLPLSPRRLEILRMAANGRTNAEIARVLFLAEESVKSHVQLIYRALGARDRANAVAIGLVRGLIRPHEIELRAPGAHRQLAASVPAAPSRALRAAVSPVPAPVAPEPRRSAAGASGANASGFVGHGSRPGCAGDSRPDHNRPEEALSGPSRGPAAPGGPVPASSPTAPATATVARWCSECQSEPCECIAVLPPTPELFTDPPTRRRTPPA